MYWESWDSTCRPHYRLLEWTFVVAATYLFGTYRVARVANREALVRMMLMQGGLLLTAVLVFAIYHVYHAGIPQPDWDTYCPPFHEQLAVPVGLALVLAPLFGVIALETDRLAARTRL